MAWQLVQAGLGDQLSHVTQFRVLVWLPGQRPALG